MSDEAVRNMVMNAAARVAAGEPTVDRGDFTQYLTDNEKILLEAMRVCRFNEIDSDLHRLLVPLLGLAVEELDNTAVTPHPFVLPVMAIARLLAEEVPS